MARIFSVLSSTFDDIIIFLCDRGTDCKAMFLKHTRIEECSCAHFVQSGSVSETDGNQ